MENKGSVLKEIFIVMAILVLCVLIFNLRSVKEKHPQPICKWHLRQMGIALATYVNDYGKSIYAPDAEGAYFLGRLYKVGLLIDPNVYLCPTTTDSNRNEDLGSDSDIQPNWISYAGRKNKNGGHYPGIRSFSLAMSSTTVASDDWEAGANHENGQYIRFLFYDGHVEAKRDETLTGDDYRAFATKGEKLADPLTN